MPTTGIGPGGARRERLILGRYVNLPANTGYPAYVNLPANTGYPALREILGEDGAAALMRSELAGRLVRVPVDHSARAAKEQAIKAALDRGAPYTVAAREAGVSRSTACRVGKR